jgi:hypothetical protein
MLRQSQFWNHKFNPVFFYLFKLEESLLRAFHGFGQAKFPDVGLVSGSGQLSKLPQLPPKIMLDSKVVKIDPKILLC